MKKKTTLEKFEADYYKLLAKYPTVYVYGDMNGTLCASATEGVAFLKTVKLPSCHNQQP